MNLSIPIPVLANRGQSRLDIYQTQLRTEDAVILLGHDPRSSKWKHLQPQIREIYEKIQRKTAKNRRDSLTRYIQFRIGPQAHWIGALPALSIGVEQAQDFKPTSSEDPDVGLLLLKASPQNRRIVLDGLGRLSAALDMIDDNSLPQEVRDFVREMKWGVSIYTGSEAKGNLTPEELGQLFHDFNVLATPASKGQAIDLDNSDIYIQMVKAVARMSALRDNGGVEPRASKVGPDSKYMAVKSSLLKFVRAATEGPGGHIDHIRDTIANPTLVDENFEQTSQKIAHYLDILSESMGSRWTNRSHLHLSNPGWLAQGLVFHDLYFVLADKLTDEERSDYVRKIGKIDWSPSNQDFFRFLGKAKKKGDEFLRDQDGKIIVAEFYGGSRAYNLLANYIRLKIGVSGLLPVEEGDLKYATISEFLDSFNSSETSN